MFNKIKVLYLKLYNSFLDLIYKKKCIICGCLKTDELLCKSCLKEINFLSGFPQKIYKEIPIYSSSVYDGNIKTIIQQLKFKHKKQNSKVLASLLYSYFKKLKISDDLLIVYPPTYFLKSLNRGYNPIELVIKEFSKLTSYKYIKNLFFKIKYTKPQYSVKNRHKNIKDSFKINLNVLKKIKENKNLTILLIDDITTSGATLEELINLILDNGFNKIICLTICKSKK